MHGGQQSAPQTGMKRVRSLSNENPFHLVEGQLIPSPVIKLGGASGGVIGHRSSLLQRSTVLQIRRDPSGPEGVITDARLDASGGSSSADHRVSVCLGEGSSSQ